MVHRQGHQRPLLAMFTGTCSWAKRFKLNHRLQPAGPLTPITQFPELQPQTQARLENWLQLNPTQRFSPSMRHDSEVATAQLRRGAGPVSNFVMGSG